MLHVVNLDGAMNLNDSKNLRALDDILYSINLPLQFGGGVRSIADVQKLDDLGVTRIVVGTAAIENPLLLQSLLDEFGSTIVVGIDARDGKVALRGWQKTADITALDLAQKVADMGVERIVYTDISRDGMMSGINLEATREIAEVSGLKVTASGGVASLDDIYNVKDLEEFGVDSLIIGKALYEGLFTLEDALDAADE